MKIRLIRNKPIKLREFAEFWYDMAHSKRYRFWFFESKWDDFGIKKLTKKSLRKMIVHWREKVIEWDELMEKPGEANED